MIRVVLGFALLASAMTAAHAQDLGTMDNPLPLSCSTAAEVIADAATAPVIAGKMTVAETDFEAIPPMVLGCPGSPHIVCVLESSMGDVVAGAEVEIRGRLAGGDDKFVVVDPCGLLVP